MFPHRTSAPRYDFCDVLIIEQVHQVRRRIGGTGVDVVIVDENARSTG